MDVDADAIPRLEPHLDLAGVYGVSSWVSVCDARGDPRGVDHEVALHYLLAWCTARRGNPSDALDDLARLVDAAGIAASVRADVVDLLVETNVDAASALRWLAAHHCDDDRTLDRLAGAYASSDRVADAALTNRAAGNRALAPGLRCRQLARGLRLDPTVDASAVHTALRELGPRDPACASIARGLMPADVERCPLVTGRWSSGAACTTSACELDLVAVDVERCRGLVMRDRDLEPGVYLHAALAHWPAQARDVATWLAYAELAARASAADGGPELAVAALENAALMSDCSAPARQRIAEATRALLSRVPPVIAARKQDLVELTPGGCWKLRAVTLRR